MLQTAARNVARLALRHPPIEACLRFVSRHERLRRATRSGAIVLSYADVLDTMELRVAEFDKYRIYVNVAEYPGLHAFFFGESIVSWVVPPLVKPGSICVDIGANFGLYTIEFASLVGAKGKVFAFEPNPEVFQHLSRSVALNGWQDRVVLRREAHWIEGGQELTFFPSGVKNTATSSLVNHGIGLKPETDRITVRTTTLVSLAEEHRIDRFHFVKVDVERAELEVLQGMRPLLSQRRIDYLLVELFAHHEAQALLLSEGYRGFKVDEIADTLVPLDNVEKGVFGDYLFVAPGVTELPRSASPRRTVAGSRG